MAGIAVVIVTDEEQRILFEHGHDNVEQFADIDAFGDSIAELALRHSAGTA